MSSRLNFEVATKKDLDNIFSVIDSANWGETQNDIKRVFQLEHSCYLLVTSPEENLRIIGVVLLSWYDSFGFIGHLVIVPEYRNQGIGYFLMKEAIAVLKVKGCKSIKLDAVQRAVSLYKRLGFKTELASLRYQKDFGTTNNFKLFEKEMKDISNTYPIHQIKEDDMAEIIDFDKTFFGGNRREFLFQLFKDFPEFSFLIRDNKGLINGYSFGTYEKGNLKIRAGIADSVNTALQLYNAAYIIGKNKKNFNKISVGIPEKSKNGIAALERMGFKDQSKAIRMYYGKKTKATINPAIIAIGDPAKG
jgi:GNAT superfamily N-acetyltransferase